MELEVFKVPSLSDFKKTSLELRELRGRRPRPWHQLVKPKETDTLLHSHQWEDTVFCPSSWQPELPVLPFPVGHRNVWIFSTLQDVLFQFRLQLEVPTKLHTGTFSPCLHLKLFGAKRTIVSHIQLPWILILQSSRFKDAFIASWRRKSSQIKGLYCRFPSTLAPLKQTAGLKNGNLSEKTLQCYLLCTWK